MSQDPLYQWRKHSGFKKGLATDIVLGDLRKWTGTAQYETTMHSDFNADQSQLNQKAQLSNAFRKPKQNIYFGDQSAENKSRFESLTANDFKTPPLDRDITVTAKPGSLRKQGTDHIEKNHRKSINATSSAHIGLETRKDLPIDDKHFKCFSTSSADAFVNFSNQVKEITGAIKNKSSSIEQGDLKHILNYTTMQAQSYVPHPSEAYHIQRTKIPNTKTSIVFGQKNNAPKIVGEDDIYTSTSSAAYQLKEKSDLQGIIKPKLNSSIVLGEFKKEMTSPSVTQSDFKMHCESLVNHNNSEYKKKSNKHSSGLIAALAPEPLLKLSAESCTCSTYKSHSQMNYDRSAGLDFGSKKNGNLSSIPFGDPQGYHMGMFKTTNGHDFHAYNGVHISHPVLGAKLTKSQVTFGEQGGPMDAEDRYNSTTHLAFVQYPESVAALGRGVSVKPKANLKENDQLDYSMRNNVTTHADHYKLPKLTTERIFGQTPAKTVPRKMLFPLRSQHGVFGTITSDSFSFRPELLFSKAQATQEAHKKAILRQLRTKSSVAFGDPSLTYFGDTKTINA